MQNQDFESPKNELCEFLEAAAEDLELPHAGLCSGLSCGEIAHFQMPLPEALRPSELPGFPHWRRLPSFSHLQASPDSPKSSDSGPSVLERIVEEDSEPEERSHAALVAVLPPEYCAYAPTQTPIAPPEREGLARPLGAGEFRRKGSSPANGRASIQVCFQGWPAKRCRATTTVATRST